MNFFQQDLASIPYENVRDSLCCVDVRQFIENIWAQYQSHADQHFLEDAKQHFHQRTWEMYLWYVLESHGLGPRKPGPAGPDYRLRSDSQQTWVEAIAPSRGEGPDAVPRLRFINEMSDSGKEPVAQEVPEEAIILRFTQALQDKLRKYEEYQLKDIVREDDSFVITINGCVATDYRGEPPVPYVVKATIGLGHLMVLFDPTGSAPAESTYQRRKQVLKTNQNPVSTDLFLREEYKGISGVLYSPVDICNIPETMGSEMYYFHNPLAKNPLAVGTFKFCREYRVDLEQGKLEHRDWHVDSGLPD